MSTWAIGRCGRHARPRTVFGRVVGVLQHAAVLRAQDVLEVLRLVGAAADPPAAHAYQVPPGVTPPSSLSGVTNATGDVRHSTYSFSQSYTDQLEVTSAALPGMRWRGYISEPEL